MSCENFINCNAVVLYFTVITIIRCFSSHSIILYSKFYDSKQINAFLIITSIVNINITIIIFLFSSLMDRKKNIFFSLWKKTWIKTFKTHSNNKHYGTLTSLMKYCIRCIDRAYQNYYYFTNKLLFNIIFKRKILFCNIYSARHGHDRTPFLHFYVISKRFWANNSITKLW